MSNIVDVIGFGSLHDLRIQKHRCVSLVWSPFISDVKPNLTTPEESELLFTLIKKALLCNKNLIQFIGHWQIPISCSHHFVCKMNEIRWHILFPLDINRLMDSIATIEQFSVEFHFMTYCLRFADFCLDYRLKFITVNRYVLLNMIVKINTSRHERPESYFLPENEVKTSIILGDCLRIHWLSHTTEFSTLSNIELSSNGDRNKNMMTPK